MADRVAQNPNAIGYVGLAYVTPHHKQLTVGGKVATMETALNYTYPIARPLFIYTKEEPKGAIKEYIEWLFSDEGQKIVSDIGYVPVDSAGPARTGPATVAPIQVTGSDTMVNLAQQWAENYGSKCGNDKIQVSGGGSGVGIAGLIDGTVDNAAYFALGVSWNFRMPRFSSGDE